MTSSQHAPLMNMIKNLTNSALYVHIYTLLSLHVDKLMYITYI